MYKAINFQHNVKIFPLLSVVVATCLLAGTDNTKMMSSSAVLF